MHALARLILGPALPQHPVLVGEGRARSSRSACSPRAPTTSAAPSSTSRISTSAGARYGQLVPPAELRRLIRDARARARPARHRSTTCSSVYESTDRGRDDSPLDHVDRRRGALRLLPRSGRVRASSASCIPETTRRTPEPLASVARNVQLFTSAGGLGYNPALASETTRSSAAAVSFTLTPRARRNARMAKPDDEVRHHRSPGPEDRPRREAGRRRLRAARSARDQRKPRTSSCCLTSGGWCWPTARRGWAATRRPASRSRSRPSAW